MIIQSVKVGKKKIIQFVVGFSTFNYDQFTLLESGLAQLVMVHTLSEADLQFFYNENIEVLSCTVASIGYHRTTLVLRIGNSVEFITNLARQEFCTSIQICDVVKEMLLLRKNTSSKS